VAFALSENASVSGDHDGASRYLLRVLERDPYDENAHLALITAQINARHHGEARRYYRFYCMRMEQIDVEAAPFPSAIPVTV
jgi:DNA-binding SARP family transcriptional activator